MNDFLSTIDFEMLLKIISIMITALTTYFVTKYTTNKPRKLDIKQRQLDKVYLPIYKIIKFNSSTNMDKKTALACATAIKEILIENYELAFPQLYDLNNNFIAAIHLDNDYQELYKKISYQVNLDYILLKKALGYPTQSTIEIFKRMKTKDKYKSIIGWSFVIYISSVPIFVTLFDRYFINAMSFIKFIAIYIGIFFFLYTLHCLVDRMRD